MVDHITPSVPKPESEPDGNLTPALSPYPPPSPTFAVMMESPVIDLTLFDLPPAISPIPSPQHTPIPSPTSGWLPAEHTPKRKLRLKTSVLDKARCKYRLSDNVKMPIMDLCVKDAMMEVVDAKVDAIVEANAVAITSETTEEEAAANIGEVVEKNVLLEPRRCSHHASQQQIQYYVNSR